MTRPMDLEFGPGERLWRRVEVGHVRAGTVKANALRLQISVVREKYGCLESVPQGKWNGVAETTAGTAFAVSNQPVYVVCVDDPTPAEQGHALVAMVVAPGQPVTQEPYPRAGSWRKNPKEAIRSAVALYLSV